MKQFTYLFPQYSDKKVIVLEVNEVGVSAIYEKEKIRGLLKGHYSQIGFLVLNGDPTIELFTYLLQKKDAFVVIGAYGRKMLTNILGGSRADLVMRITDLPLFITHI
jgi:nucleotide-binding universal stress UspA family protein